MSCIAHLDHMANHQHMANHDHMLDQVVCVLLQVWTEATQYLQLIGVLLGQFTFGILGDWIGRKPTMLLDMCVIIVGLIMLTVSNGTTINVSLCLQSFLPNL